MKKNWILLTLYIFMTAALIAQDSKEPKFIKNKKIKQAFELRFLNPDSAFLIWKEAQKQVLKNPNDAEAGDLYYIGTILYRMKGDNSEAKSLVSKSIQLYTRQNDSLGISLSLLEFGNIYFSEFELDSAGIYFEKSLEIKEKINDQEGKAIVLSNLGAVEDHKGNYLKASELYMKSLEINEKEGNKTQISDTYHNLSIIQYNLGLIDNAIDYQNKAVVINKEIGNKVNQGMNHVCLSAFYIEKSDIGKAAEHAGYARNIGEATGEKSLLLYAQSATSEVLVIQKKYKESLQVIQSALGSVDQAGNPYMKAQLQHKKGKVLRLLGDCNSGLPLLFEALKVFEQYNTAKELKEAYEEAALCYQAQGKYEEAYRYITMSNMHRDSVFEQEKTKQFISAEAKFKAKEKELENKQLQSDKILQSKTIRAQRIMLWIGGISLTLITLLSLLLFKQRNTQKQLKNEAIINKSQIQLLNRELNHRVKNNLAFMTSLLEMQGRRTGNTETRQLLRESETRLKTLALVHTNLFKNELDTEINLSSYLTELVSHLQSIFAIPGKSIEMVTHLTDYIINAEDAMRLGLIVNELITNSIKHAFDEVDNPVITIHTFVNEDGRLVLDYKDNGSGIMTSVTPGGSSSGSLGTKLISLLKDQLGDRYIVMA